MRPNYMRDYYALERRVRLQRIQRKYWYLTYAWYAGCVLVTLLGVLALFWTK
jgi:hypothetical protein